MNTVYIKRAATPYQKESLGVLKAKIGSATFSCKTLELPWRDNMPNISCIPKGKYRAEYTFSWRFKKFTYEIKNVATRSGIRIHSANYYRELQGCIALGDSLYDIDRDGVLDIANSRATIRGFERIMDYKPFTLIVE